MEYTYQTKSDENGMLFLHHSYNSSFEGTSIIKICKIEPPDLLFMVVFISFISADIIFHKYLELHLANIIWKKIFSSRIFLF